MNQGVRGLLFLLLVLVLSIVIIVPSASAQTIVKRTRLGSTVEGITFITNGPNANHIAVMDGMDLIAVPINGQGPSKKLFSFVPLGMTVAPRGIGYIGSEKLFVLAEWPTVDEKVTFRLVDHKGRLAETIDFVWPEDLLTSRFYVEGVTWVPVDAPKYAGDIIFAGRPRIADVPQQLFVMNRMGELVDRIMLPDTSWMDPIGLTYRQGGTLLLGNIDNTIFELDLNGTLLNTQSIVSMDLEGVASLPGREVAVTTHALGKLLFMNPNLQPTGKERVFQAGIGLNGALYSVAWKNDTNEFLLHAADADTYLGLPQVAALSEPVSAKRNAYDLIKLTSDPYWFIFNGLDYVGTEGLIAMGKRGTPERDIFLFDQWGGVYWSQLGYAATDRVTALAYVSTTNQFAVKRMGLDQSFGIVDRWGVPVRTVDLSAYLGAADRVLDLAVKPDNGNGEFLVLATNGVGRQCLRVSFDGGTVTSYDLGSLGLTTVASLKAITSGLYAGDLVALDSNTSELVVFTLP